MREVKLKKRVSIKDYHPLDEAGRHDPDSELDKLTIDSDRVSERMHFDRERMARSFIDRARDEIRSWLGDVDAAQRRRLDEHDRERDGERKSNRAPHNLDNACVGDVMTSAIVTVYPWETVERAARLMRRCDCGVLPVLDEDRVLIGMITDRDITLRTISLGIDPRYILIGDCMSHNIFAGHENDSIGSCMRQMAR
jgi:CBS-domain-containing membrane protein